MNLEETESLDTNGNNLENSNKENTTINSDQKYFKGLDAPILSRFDEVNVLDKEVNTTFFDECCEV